MYIDSPSKNMQILYLSSTNICSSSNNHCLFYYQYQCWIHNRQFITERIETFQVHPEDNTSDYQVTVADNLCKYKFHCN